VKALRSQAEHLSAQGLTYEIVVADDGSTEKNVLAANATIDTLPCCRYIHRKQNTGRSTIRNFLVRESQYEWLLFLDCDMQLPGNQFLRTYLSHNGADIIDGGFSVAEQPELLNHNLRYSYEWTEQANHSTINRQKRPYRSFRSTNFMVRREIMIQHPFDERFRHYGYEDVMFGKELHRHAITIAHIDNPMILTDNEPNEVFVKKTEEALRTLHTFRHDLQGYSHLLTFINGIHIGLVRSFIRLFHRIFGPLERHNLCSTSPSLTVFKLYKIGYYLTLTKND
jgi:glycosyltransferase involved in cell wall biosynthesis